MTNSRRNVEKKMFLDIIECQQSDQDVIFFDVDFLASHYRSHRRGTRNKYAPFLFIKIILEQRTKSEINRRDSSSRVP